MSKKPSAKAAPKGLTKAQMISELAGRTGLPKTQVTDFMDKLFEVVSEELHAGKPVSIPGIVKVTLKHKPATPARPGRNPFTGEAITIKAKPARKAVKVSALKPLRDLA